MLHNTSIYSVENWIYPVNWTYIAFIYTQIVFYIAEI